MVYLIMEFKAILTKNFEFKNKKVKQKFFAFLKWLELFINFNLIEKITRFTSFSILIFIKTKKNV